MDGIMDGIKKYQECTKLIETNKSNIVGYSCIIDRSNNKVLVKGQIVSQIKLKIETFKNNDLPDELKKIKPVKPGSRNLSK